MRSLLLAACALLAVARAHVGDLSLAAGRALPFAVEPHPLRLSSLFSRQESANADASPFPTGAWWTNLVLAQGDAPVVALPYALRVVDHKAHVSFPFRVVTPSVIQSGFIAQLVLSAAEAPASHQVVAFDSFGVHVRFASDSQELFTLLLVRGSPYLTMEFAGARPVLESSDGLSLVRLKKLDALVFMDGSDVEFAVFSVQVSNGQAWYAFASDPELELELVDGRVQATRAFTGALRVALSLEATTMPYLLESASVYPTGALVNYSVAANDEASLDFRWKTKTFAAYSPDTDSSKRRNAQLLMLALPHHIDTMEIQTPSQDKKLANKVVNTFRYSSIRGLMKGVLGSVWYMREQLLPVEWHFKDQGLFSDEYSVKEIGASSTVDAERRKRLAMRAEAEKKIIASLQQDISTYPILMGDDSYNFGKQIARETRLLLLAEKFGQQDVVDHQLKKIKDGILPWLDGTNPDKFVYDETYGGLVTSFGLHNQEADYGNGYYNDHHVRTAL